MARRTRTHLVLGLVLCAVALVAGVTIKRGPGSSGDSAPSLDFSSDPSCNGVWAYNVNTMDATTGSDDIGLVTGEQNLSTVASAPAIANTTLPGTWGAGGTDPRRYWDFDGTDDAVGFTDSTDIFGAVDDITMCVWAWRDSDGALNIDRFISKGVNAVDSNTELTGLRVTGADIYRFTWHGDTLDSVATIPVDTWVHVCGTMDINAPPTGALEIAKIYINGEQEAGSAMTATQTPAGGQMQLGAGGFAIGGTNQHDGRIHEAFACQRALSAAEICAVCRCGFFDQIQDRGAACGGCALPTGALCTY
jgi:hypothetical protein